MCGRYTLHHSTNEIVERFHVQQVELDLIPRYNIAPSHLVAVIAQKDGDSPKRSLQAFKWGLVPFWVKDVQKHKPFINSRCETLAEKPSFKAALVRRRCIIPADGFFEWKTTPRGKVPMYITLADGKPFALAGIWEEWKSPDGTPLRTCSIITVPANELMAQIHDRMPAILAPEQEDVWLDPDLRDKDKILSMLAPYDPQQMVAHPVSTLVNSPGTDSVRCIEKMDMAAVLESMPLKSTRKRSTTTDEQLRVAEETVQLKIGVDA
ncbi:MAG TPA: SOS response-associated peptidase [Candidatus Obscuribacterales bacterium]